jgi:curved DNA-binding protein CbpA
MNPIQQHFNYLNLPFASTRAEVKAQYYRLALTCHPDKVSPAQKAVATENFKILQGAYDGLNAHFDQQEAVAEANRREWEARKAREAREERIEREGEAREEERKNERLKREYVRLQEEAKREKEREARREKESRNGGLDEVRKMRAAWQQTYAEAEKEGRVGRNGPSTVRVEIDLTQDEEVAPAQEEKPAKIKFSLLNLKKK